MYHGSIYILKRTDTKIKQSESCEWFSNNAIDPLGNENINNENDLLGNENINNENDTLGNENINKQELR